MMALSHPVDVGIRVVVGMGTEPGREIPNKVRHQSGYPSPLDEQ